MNIENNLIIISCGIGEDALSCSSKTILQKAEIVAGGRNLLERYAEEDQEQIVIAANAVDVCKDLIKRSQSKKVVILASGDSLYNGIAGTIRKLASTEKISVIPNITAFQELFSRLCISWHDVQLFSVHGNNGKLPWRQILCTNKAIVYGDNVLTADKIAKLLIEKFPGSKKRNAVIAVNLGLPDEIIINGTLEELAVYSVNGLSILTLLECTSNLMPSIALGLENSDFIHEKSLITKSEIRAVILSKLNLKPGVMWDLGAGSGSVGLEAAGLLNNLSVHSVERVLSRFENIKFNIKTAGLSNIKAIQSDILPIISDLPNPDIIFIGGGGVDIKEIVETAFLYLNSKGRLVVSSVTLDSAAALSSILIQYRKEVVNLSISHSKPVGELTMMKAENPITLFVYEKGEK
ncbi:MAG: precorrin-6y C5,15-methyltransferase (decarboxylating) subunit CbiE [bacterium]|nr:precorrin-6y C5,15-methyltransferase (decarboxylating) subunit CbiE [bacterium]